MEQDVYFFGYTAYVTYQFLTRYGISLSTIYNNTSPKAAKGKKWHTSTLQENKKRKLVAYDSIPISFTKKYNLPGYPQLRDIYDQGRDKIKEVQSNDKAFVLKKLLEIEYNKWETIQPIYQNELLTGEKLEIFCKTHVVLNKVCELSNCGYKLKELFEVYCTYEDMAFKPVSYKSFCKKVNRIQAEGNIEEVLIHGLVSLPSNNLKKTEDVILEIKRLYYSGKKPNAATILEQVNDYLVRSNRKPISISSIYNVISQDFIKNEGALARHGKKYVEDNMLPHFHFDSPKAPGILWAMDGSRFQFAYKSETGKFNFLTFFVIIDGCTKKILGYSSGDSENSMMVKSALEMACKQTRYLPREIVSDNSSAFKSQELIRIKGIIKILGADWRHIKFKNPRDNGYVERFFGVFQEKCCKNYEGYLGEGIKSKRLDARPSPEEIQAHLTGKNLRTKEELLKLLDTLILRYNRSREAGLGTGNKGQIENNGVKQVSARAFRPIWLGVIQFGELFWPTRVTTVKHGEVSFEIDKQEYIYQIYDDQLLLKLHGNQVLVRYCPDNAEQVLIFDLQTEKYICTLKRYKRIPKAKIERSPEDDEQFYKCVQKSKGLKRKLFARVEDLYNKSEKNREVLPPPLSEFIPMDKKHHEETETAMMKDELNEFIGNRSFTKKDEPDYEDIFKNLYSKKGSLKLFKYGNN